MFKRFLPIIALITLLVLPSTANAENYTWKDPKFNFSGLDKIQLLGLEVHEDTKLRNFYPDESAANTMEKLIQVALSKKNIELLTPTEEKDVIKLDANAVSIRPDMLNADINIYKYGYTKTYVPSYVEEYTSYEKITHIDSKGNKSETTIPITKTRVVPAHYFYVAYIDIEITLYDPINNKQIFTYRDMRDRSSESSPLSMAKRISDSFVDALSKAKKIQE